MVLSSNDMLQRCPLLGSRFEKTMGVEALPSSSNEADDPKNQYRCCCSTFHVSTASIVIAIVELFYLGYEIFSSFYLFNRTGDQYILSFSLSLFATFLAIVAVILLILAIKTSTPYLLVPHLLMQVAVTIVLFLMCLFCLFAVFVGTSIEITVTNVERSREGEKALKHLSVDPNEYNMVCGTLIVSLLLGSAIALILSILQIGMLRIVISCYRYLQEKQFLKMQSSSSRETPLGSGDADVTSLNGGVPADKNGDPLAAIHGNDLHSVAISNIDIREFTNPAETDC